MTLLRTMLLSAAAGASPWVVALIVDTASNLGHLLGRVPVAWHLRDHYVWPALFLASLLYATVAIAYCALCAWKPDVLRRWHLRVLDGFGHDR
jgi:hypothetical protein